VLLFLPLSLPHDPMPPRVRADGALGVKPFAGRGRTVPSALTRPNLIGDDDSRRAFLDVPDDGRPWDAGIVQVLHEGLRLTFRQGDEESP
jgi:hypothetical protein